MSLSELKRSILHAAKTIEKYGLITLSGGNVSAREPESGLIAITPSGIGYDDLTPDDMVVIDLESNIVEGRLKPSFDTVTHLYIYQHKPEIHSIIHTHSPYASCFAVLNKTIPVVQTTLANAVGGEVPLARYVAVGEDDTGPAVVEAIGDKKACLLANHGVLAMGPNVDAAVKAAVMLEDAARVYHLAMTAGKPNILPESEVQKARDLFIHYGQKVS
ncbi:MAG: hypothetical protein GY801_48255 [bacterium]|nr:hypothetical protein [bacterium]